MVAKGDKIVKKNFDAVDRNIANLFKVKIPDKVTSKLQLQPAVSDNAPDFVKEVTAKMIKGEGDDVPVSKMPIDGTYPTCNNKVGKEKYSIRSSRLGCRSMYSM